jgi:cysteinyl-tRNA synthetase
MSLQFKNTLGGAVAPFEPLEPGRVRMYSCGPTVYAPAHVGNFRAFVFADLVHRVLLFCGYEVTWVMNITDVDDKIIRDAGAAGEDISHFTARHTQAFLDDLAVLNIDRPDILPRATEHIEEMVTLIETLLEKGHAYRADDGSIFFRIASWPTYGKLANIDPSQQRSGERVESDEYDKESIRDFALWKAAKPGEPSWSTAIGKGRPGWHIECSAMSMRYLGPSFDIHTGGIDLVFPHHEDEIAQSEAATGQPFAHTWLHNAHLRMGGAKMAKSTGNIARPADLYDAGVSPRALRYALLATHYRSPLEFSDHSLEAAAGAVERLNTAVKALDDYAQDGPDDGSLPQLLRDARAAFTAGLEDDLNISAALGAAFDLVRELNSRVAERSLSTADAQRGAAAIRELDTVLGLLVDDADDELSPELATMLEARTQARAARDWARSDELRDALAEAGLIVEDTPDGQRWRRA